jgi:quercetin dioxygenase-like cupin family protein
VTQPRELTIKHVDDEPWGSAERFGFPPGPECRIYSEGENGFMAIIGRFPPGFVEPRHVHDDVDHWCVVLDGEMHLAGEVLTRGDYFYAPVGVPHGPLEYPVGCTVFTTVRGQGFAHHFGDSP